MIIRRLMKNVYNNCLYIDRFITICDIGVTQRQALKTRAEERIKSIAEIAEAIGGLSRHYKQDTQGYYI